MNAERWALRRKGQERSQQPGRENGRKQKTIDRLEGAKIRQRPTGDFPSGRPGPLTDVSDAIRKKETGVSSQETVGKTKKINFMQREW